jgi:hypothetical protein
MRKYTIVPRRDVGMEGFMSNQSLGTDAFNLETAVIGYR